MSESNIKLGLYPVSEHGNLIIPRILEKKSNVSWKTNGVNLDTGERDLFLSLRDTPNGETIIHDIKMKIFSEMKPRLKEKFAAETEKELFVKAREAPNATKRLVANDECTREVFMKVNEGVRQQLFGWDDSDSDDSDTDSNSTYIHSSDDELWSGFGVYSSDEEYVEEIKAKKVKSETNAVAKVMPKPKLAVPMENLLDPSSRFSQVECNSEGLNHLHPAISNFSTFLEVYEVRRGLSCTENNIMPLKLKDNLKDRMKSFSDNLLTADYETESGHFDDHMDTLQELIFMDNGDIMLADIDNTEVLLELSCLVDNCLPCLQHKLVELMAAQSTVLGMADESRDYIKFLLTVTRPQLSELLRDLYAYFKGRLTDEENFNIITP